MRYLICEKILCHWFFRDEMSCSMNGNRLMQELRQMKIAKLPSNLSVSRVAFSLTDFLCKLIQAETSFNSHTEPRRHSYLKILQFSRNNFLCNASRTIREFYLDILRSHPITGRRTWNGILSSHTQPLRAKRIQQAAAHFSKANF